MTTLAKTDPGRALKQALAPRVLRDELEFVELFSAVVICRVKCKVIYISYSFLFFLRNP